MIEACGDNRFEIIREAKEALIASTNITQSPKEMAVLNDFLFRCWQMGWLKKYEPQPTTDGWIPVRMDIGVANLIRNMAKFSQLPITI